MNVNKIIIKTILKHMSLQAHALSDNLNNFRALVQTQLAEITHKLFCRNFKLSETIFHNEAVNEESHSLVRQIKERSFRRTTKIISDDHFNYYLY